MQSGLSHSSNIFFRNKAGGSDNIMGMCAAAFSGYTFSRITHPHSCFIGVAERQTKLKLLGEGIYFVILLWNSYTKYNNIESAMKNSSNRAMLSSCRPRFIRHFNNDIIELNSSKIPQLEYALSDKQYLKYANSTSNAILLVWCRTCEVTPTKWYGLFLLQCHFRRYHSTRESYN